MSKINMKTEHHRKNEWWKIHENLFTLKLKIAKLYRISECPFDYSLSICFVDKTEKEKHHLKILSVGYNPPEGVRN